MAKINLLDKSVFELIAAGEVIERPSSVIKELVENAIDAGATQITVEIKNGGASFMRVTDNGCGIAHDELPTAFLRHATSKVSSAEDLERIFTLGFRGEALASVAAVSHVEVLTKEESAEMGSCFKISGGEIEEHGRSGCPDGTTVIIRDLFFNVPARRKFLKKDISEGNQVQSLVDKLALAHPDIAFRFIRDNKLVRDTAGNGDLYAAAYAVFGKQFALGLIPVDFELNGVAVSGYISSPLFTRANRSLQHFFVNGRYVRSVICMTALEEGFRNSIMTGKFPACILNVTLSPELLDVNVSPSKTEVRFAYEKSVFDAVHFAVKNAILNADNGREIKLEKRAIPAVKVEEKPSSDLLLEKALSAINEEAKKPVPISEVREVPKSERVFSVPEKPVYLNSPIRDFKPLDNRAPFVQQRFSEPKKADIIAVFDEDEMTPVSAKKTETEENSEFKYLSNLSFQKNEEKPEPIITTEEEKPSVRIIGEIFATYIICEIGDEMAIIDKHAAHERIRFEKRRTELVTSSQLLAESEFVELTSEQYSALEENMDLLSDIGLEVILSDGVKGEVTACPSAFSGDTAKISPSDMVIKAADLLVNGNRNLADEFYDDLQHSRACKSAIKANDVNSMAELRVLVDEVMADERIRFCPHGRPVIVKLTKREIEKYFSRIV